VPKSEEENVRKGIDWLNRNDQPQQAIDAFQDVLDRYPDLAPVHALIGLAYERLDDSGQAVEHFRRAMELRPDAAEPYLYLADLYTTKQKPEVAEEYYQKALDRNPLLDRAYQQRGQSAVMRADAPAALANFHALVALRPDDPFAHKLLASGFELAGQYDQAETELKGCIERDDRDIDAKLRLAYLYLALKQRTGEKAMQARYKQQAIDAFQKVLDAQPENASASRAVQELKSQP
jgi:tetratricopeptide (TPR) repeat protein